MRFLYPFISPTVSNDKKQLLEQQLIRENIKRTRLFAKIVILFEFLIILMNVSSAYIENQGLVVFDVYLILYLTLLLTSVLMLFYLHWFEKQEYRSDWRFKLYQGGLEGFVVFFLVWGAAVTLIDQLSYGHVMAYVVNVMCVSILYHASNRTILLINSIPTAVLFLGLPFFQSSSEVLMGHYTNLVVFLFFCWLASRMMYTSYSTNFYNKLLLSETNENLMMKIQENESINQELAKANEQLRQLTLIDELTKIPNRRGFQNYIKQAFKKTDKKRQLSIMMLDVDSFKLFNDNYGHLEGDRVIWSVAQKIKDCLDSGKSMISRFGGEEFIVAAFDMDEDRVIEIAETIRKAVQELKITHEYSPVSKYVTVSIGISSEFVVNKGDIDNLILEADRALYQAKTMGRNQVWCLTPDTLMSKRIE